MTVLTRVNSDVLARITRIVEGVRAAMEQHGATCGDRVLGVAISTSDHALLGIAELWGVPVLAWDDVDDGRFRLLCEAMVVLIPRVETPEDLFERWTYGIQPDDLPDPEFAREPVEVRVRKPPADPLS